MTEARIRRARRDEAEELTALMHRSKAHWGYPEALMARFAEDLRLMDEQVIANEVWVLEDTEGRRIGFYQLIDAEPAILEDLWVDPPAIGAGHGRRLWEHALATARARGASAIELDADPNAQAFYERMGARVVGATPSERIAGRSLPRMRIDLG